ncbi:MAG: hypothetical protein Q7U38_13380 [Methylobacter sp.]|nr:hypothetical protein [Methylobacter sp.]MDP2100470.1 hypothetical protein [Methylobacter sp.]MDP2428330.1 hypothetical protein [Methylobacter sp.]MDP3055681.1 hypothetical protein [Methylobacter sp.]MDP3361383.1 hypothetical protein [Methylobacter sp.]
MAKVKAYHAGDVEKIEHFIAGQQYMASSYSTNNWLGDGLYFWENNPTKAEKWLIQKNKGAIMECDIDTENLLNSPKKSVKPLPSGGGCKMPLIHLVCSHSVSAHTINLAIETVLRFRFFLSRRKNLLSSESENV